MAQRSKALHRNVVASLQPGVLSQAVSLPAVTRTPLGRCTTGPVLAGVGEGVAGDTSLGSSCSSDSLWRAGCLQADLGHQLNSVSSALLNTSSLNPEASWPNVSLVKLAYGLSELG